MTFGIVVLLVGAVIVYLIADVGLAWIFRTPSTISHAVDYLRLLVRYLASRRKIAIARKILVARIDECDSRPSVEWDDPVGVELDDEFMVAVALELVQEWHQSDKAEKVLHPSVWRSAFVDLPKKVLWLYPR